MNVINDVTWVRYDSKSLAIIRTSRVIKTLITTKRSFIIKKQPLWRNASATLFLFCTCSSVSVYDDVTTHLLLLRVPSSGFDFTL